MDRTARLCRTATTSTVRRSVTIPAATWPGDGSGNGIGEAVAGIVPTTFWAPRSSTSRRHKGAAERFACVSPWMPISWPSAAMRRRSPGCR